MTPPNIKKHIRVKESTFILILLFLANIKTFVFGSGYEFEGVGAREVSRGGAAIAHSNDWTAIYWNPANLTAAAQENKGHIGLELFGGTARSKDSNSLSTLPGIGAAFTKDRLSSNFLLGAFGAALPIGERGGLGFGFYTPLLQGAKFTDTSPTTTQGLDYKASAGILVWNVSYGYQLSPQLVLGTGLNLLYGQFKSRASVSNFLLPGNTTTSELDGDGWATEGMLGVRYQATDKLTAGLIYRSGSDVPIKGDATVESSSILIADESSSFRYDLRHPPTSGIGLSYKATPKWTVDFDFTQTYWNRFSNAIRYQNPGTFIQSNSNSFDWRNTWKLRLGSEWKLSEKTDLMAGYSYDRYALDDNSIDFASAIDVPMNRFYGGTARRWNDSWSTLLGAVIGYGERTSNNVHYILTGFQFMIESQYRFK